MKALYVSCLLSASSLLCLAAGQQYEALNRLRSTVGEVKNLDERKTEVMATELLCLLNTEGLPATREGVANIYLGGKSARLLLNSSTARGAKATDLENPALSAVEKYLDAVSGNIDEQWEFQPVYANVGPPKGVPNAISGMNPDAIEDEGKRREYLERIEANQRTNLKNAQQSKLRYARESILRGIASMIGKAGWSEAEVFSRFGKRKENRAFLKKHAPQESGGR